MNAARTKTPIGDNKNTQDVGPVKPAGQSVGDLCSHLSPDVLNDHIHFSTGSGYTDTRPKYEWIPVQTLIQRLSQPKVSARNLSSTEYHRLDSEGKKRQKNGPWFYLLQLNETGDRKAENVLWISGFVMDIDKGNWSYADIQQRMDGHFFIALTTYSHRPFDQRWRVIVVYAQPITPEHHRRVYEHFQKLFNGDLDNKCSTASQIWLSPACPPDVVSEYQFHVGAGPLFDPKTLPPTAAEMVQNKQNVKAPVVLSSVGNLTEQEASRLRSALAAIPSDEYGVWIRIALALKNDLGESGRILWLEWSRSSDKFDPDVANATWDSLQRLDKDQKRIGLGSVFYMAENLGWKPPSPAMHPTLQELDKNHFVVMDGGKCLVYREGLDPDTNWVSLTPMTVTAFTDFLSNQKVTVSTPNGNKVINAGRAWLDHRNRRTFQHISFEPGRVVAPGTYNLWRGFPVVPASGDWGLLRQHIFNILCGGNQAHCEYLLNWMAFAVQHPGKPAEVAVVLQGDRGAGKGIVVRLFGQLFGQHFLHISSSKRLTGQFNAHLRNCIVLFADEAFWAGDKEGENALKALITEPTLAIEGKGRDVITARNCLHILMASNNDWVVPAGNKERRYFVLKVDDGHMQDLPYFAAISEQMLHQGGLAAMMHDLSHRDLTHFNIRQVPKTKALDDQMMESLSTEQLWWMDQLSSHNPHWRHQPKSVLQHSFAQAVGPRFGNGSETKLGMFLNKMVTGLKHGSSPMNTTRSVKDHYVFPSQAECRRQFIERLGLQGDPWA